MIPVVDYGSIAIVVPAVTAIGGMTDVDGRYGFEVYLSGNADPVIVSFQDKDEAENARAELLDIVARFHFTREFGPDFEDEFADSFDEAGDEDTGEKKEH